MYYINTYFDVNVISVISYCQSDSVFELINFEIFITFPMGKPKQKFYCMYIAHYLSIYFEWHVHLLGENIKANNPKNCSNELDLILD